MEHFECHNLYDTFFPFWKDLDPHSKALLCTNTHAVSYKRGTLVHDGNNCTGVIVVKTGCLRVYLMPEQGREITLYRLFPGDICMLSASCVLQSITFDVAVSAEEDSSCYLVNGKTFAEVSETNLTMKNFALETAVARFSDVMWTMQQILFFSFDKRLAIFLYEELIKNGPIIRYSHMEIAKYLGSAREVVSRMLKYFENEGIVKVSRKEIEIIDKKKLMDRL